MCTFGATHRQMKYETYCFGRFTFSSQCSYFKIVLQESMNERIHYQSHVMCPYTDILMTKSFVYEWKNGGRPLYVVDIYLLPCYFTVKQSKNKKPLVENVACKNFICHNYRRWQGGAKKKIISIKWFIFHIVKIIIYLIFFLYNEII